MKKTGWIYLIILILTGAGCSKEASENIWLDEMPFGEIVNPYGPPKRDRSFADAPLQIGNQTYERGLGLHAPAELNIKLDKKVGYFSAIVGIDHEVQKYWHPDSLDMLEFGADYVYDNHVAHHDFEAGGTVVLKIFANGDSLFVSELLTVRSDPVQVKVNLSGKKNLKIVLDETGDGSFADLFVLANAKIYVQGDSNDYLIYRYPEKILLNHAGYHPSSPKFCQVHGSWPMPFWIVDKQSGKTVYKGNMEPAGGDLGQYLKGDFSDFTEVGQFFLKTEDNLSETFRISRDMYTECLQKHLQYITAQRSGHRAKGWVPGMHFDDGIRQDNGEHQDVSGGWYDACDIRKPSKGNAQLLYALTRVLETKPLPIPEKALMDEIKWGNRFLLAMQEPEGYLMHYVGYTWEGYADNRWTDNVINNDDDRIIITRPAEYTTHLLFIMAQLKIAEYLKETEPGYSQQCETAAFKAFQWIEKEELENSGDVSFMIMAAAELYRYKGKERYKRLAEGFINKLMAFKKEKKQPPVVWYENKANTSRPQEYNRVLLGMAVFLQTFPDSPLSAKVKNNLTAYLQQNLEKLTSRNAFSLIPWFVSSGNNGPRQHGGYQYRYFLHVGMNRHIAADGYALLKVTDILQKPGLKQIAQQQLDWIYGSNPFNASTAHGIGYNHPALFETGQAEFSPPTPILTGGVMTGIGATKADKIAMYPGWWWTTEYWSPTVMSTILLVNSLRDNYELK